MFVVGCSTTGASPSNAAPEQPDGSEGYEVASGEVDPRIDYSPDNFWRAMATSPETDARTMSLEDALTNAEVIVVGRAIDVVEAGGYGAPGEPVLWYGEAVVEVSEVLKGQPALDESGFLRVPFAVAFSETYPTKQLTNFQRSIPEGRAVLLMMSWAKYFESTSGGDTPTWIEGLNRADRYRTIGPEGAMRITSSGIEPPPAEGWPQMLESLSLADLKDLLSTQPPR